jgi:hypothetical protein
MKRSKADLKPVADVVSARVFKAMLDASSALTALGVRHALVGGLAVGAYGWPRATKDVDFLVDDSAWLKTEAGLVVMRAGLPVQAHGVPIDTLSIRDEEKHLEAALQTPEMSEGVPVAPVEAVVYLKLVSPRAKDRVDIIELVKAGLDRDAARRYLRSAAPSLLERFDEAARAADEEAE